MVVGAGVSGLTCAVTLAEAGHRVEVVASELSRDTVSARAAAIWYPYLAEPRHRILEWSRRTREVLNELADQAVDGAAGCGVSRVRMLEVFDRRPEGDPWWRPAVEDLRPARPDELPEGAAYGHRVEVPLADVTLYLPYLEERLRRSGATLRRLTAPLESLADVAAPGRLVVNCSGLGAGPMCDDDRLYPVRGQVAHIEPPGAGPARVWDQGPGRLTYVLPRTRDWVLGGTAEAHRADLEPQPETTEAILRRARRLAPEVAGCVVRDVVVGLRPARDQVRLERQETPCGPVVHDYGHGGAGFTLSWGCAEEVRLLVQEGSVGR